MATTVLELNNAAKEFNAATIVKEAALERFQMAMYKWDKLIEYAPLDVITKYYDQRSKETT